MEKNCLPTPLHVRSERNSKSPNQVTVSSPDSDGIKSPSGRQSPDSRCVICLGKLQRKSFTDSCLHQFCFQCLLQWSKVKPECPLCKQPFKSIIHNVRSNFDYDQYHIERREPAYVVSEIVQSYNFDLVPVDRRFRYRSTMTRDYFRELAESFLTRTRNSYQLPSFVPTTTFHIPPSPRFSPLPERRGARGSSDSRRSIYEQDLWVQDLADITGRYRECTPQFYRDNPAQVHRIIPWLNREINSLMGDSDSYNAYILDRIITLLPQYSIRSREFRNVVEPYFGNRTDHFIHEFYTFARSVYDINGFDQHAVYVPNPNYATEVQDISSSTDDSDIEVIHSLEQKSTSTGSRLRRQNLRKIFKNRPDSISHTNEPIAGPSGLSSNRPTETIEVCESDNDDIKVIEYVKPEPEVVTLSSGDEDSPVKSVRTSLLKKKSISSLRNVKDSSSECSYSSNKPVRSKNKRGKKSKSVARKNKSRRNEMKDKYKKSNVKSKRSIRSVSKSSSRSTSSEEGNEKYLPDNFSTESVYSNSTWSSVSIQLEGDFTSSSDYEQFSRAKNKKTSKGQYKKCKKNNIFKKKDKDKQESCSNGSTVLHKPRKKSKVKSCIVVPSSNKKLQPNDFVETSHYHNRHGGESSDFFGNPRNEEDGSSTLPSYWSLVLNNKFEKYRKRKRSEERREEASLSKRNRHGNEESSDERWKGTSRQVNAPSKTSENFHNDGDAATRVKHFTSNIPYMKSENSVELMGGDTLHAGSTDENAD